MNVELDEKAVCLLWKQVEAEIKQRTDRLSRTPPHPHVHVHVCRLWSGAARGLCDAREHALLGEPNKGQQDPSRALHDCPASSLVVLLRGHRCGGISERTVAHRETACIGSLTSKRMGEHVQLIVALACRLVASNRS